MQFSPIQDHEVQITGFKMSFGQVFALMGKVYAAALLWSLIIGAIVGAFLLVISLIVGVGLGSLFM